MKINKDLTRVEDIGRCYSADLACARSWLDPSTLGEGVEERMRRNLHSPHITELVSVVEQAFEPKPSLVILWMSSQAGII